MMQWATVWISLLHCSDLSQTHLGYWMEFSAVSPGQLFADGLQLRQAYTSLNGYFDCLPCLIFHSRDRTKCLSHSAHRVSLSCTNSCIFTWEMYLYHIKAPYCVANRCKTLWSNLQQAFDTLIFELPTNSMILPMSFTSLMSFTHMHWSL